MQYGYRTFFFALLQCFLIQLMAQEKPSSDRSYYTTTLEVSNPSHRAKRFEIRRGSILANADAKEAVQNLIICDLLDYPEVLTFTFIDSLETWVSLLPPHSGPFEVEVKCFCFNRNYFGPNSSKGPYEATNLFSTLDLDKLCKSQKRAWEEITNNYNRLERTTIRGQHPNSFKGAIRNGVKRYLVNRIGIPGEALDNLYLHPVMKDEENAIVADTINVFVRGKSDSKDYYLLVLDRKESRFPTPENPYYFIRIEVDVMECY